MTSPTLLEQAAVTHLDSGGAGRQRVDELDGAVASAGAEVAARLVDPTELEDRLLKAGVDFDLSGSDPTRTRG